jgi:hypothetical protein
VALRCSCLAQALIVVKAATACDDELHDGLPSGVKKRKGFCRGICLRAVCCSDTQGLLGFPWPLYLKRGWAKTCSTLPWPLRGWSLQFVLAVLTLRSQSEGAGVKAGTQRRWGARSAGLDAGASGDYRAWPCKDGKPQRPAAGQGSGPRAAPTREASLAMGHLPQRPDPRHTARPVKDQTTYRQERSDWQSPLHEGEGGERKQWHGQSAAAPVPSFVSPLGAWR